MIQTTLLACDDRELMQLQRDLINAAAPAYALMAGIYARAGASIIVHPDGNIIVLPSLSQAQQLLVDNLKRQIEVITNEHLRCIV